MIQIIKDSTRKKNYSEIVIDLIFTNCFQECTDSGVIEENLSDHYVTHIQLRENTKSKVERITYTRNLDINKFKNDFIVDLEQNHSECESFNSACQNFLNCLDNLCPLTAKRSNKPYAPWIRSVKIREAQRHRDSFRKNYKKHPNCSLTHRNLRLAIKQVDKSINCAKNHI